MFSKINLIIVRVLSFVLVASVFFFIAEFSGTANAQEQVLPFSVGDMLSQNSTGSNNTNDTDTDMGSSDGTLPCDMPPCPPDQACIQSCPK